MPNGIPPEAMPQGKLLARPKGGTWSGVKSKLGTASATPMSKQEMEHTIKVLSIERPKLKLVAELQKRNYSYHCSFKDPVSAGRRLQFGRTSTKQAYIQASKQASMPKQTSDFKDEIWVHHPSLPSKLWGGM